MGTRDAQDQFDSAHDLTASAASSNYIDKKHSAYFGAGVPLVAVILVTTAADHTTGNESYTAKLQCDDNTAFSSATDLTSEITISQNAVAGDKIYVDLPPNVNVEQYVRLYYTLGGTTPTLSVSAYLEPKWAAESRWNAASGITTR